MPACTNVRRRTGIVIFDIRTLPGRPLGVVCSHETSVNFTLLPLSNAVRTKSVTRFRANIFYPACGAVKKRGALIADSRNARQKLADDCAGIQHARKQRD